MMGLLRVWRLGHPLPLIRFFRPSRAFHTRATDSYRSMCAQLSTHLNVKTLHNIHTKWSNKSHTPTASFHSGRTLRARKSKQHLQLASLLGGSASSRRTDSLTSTQKGTSPPDAHVNNAVADVETRVNPSVAVKPAVAPPSTCPPASTSKADLSSIDRVVHDSRAWKELSASDLYTAARQTYLDSAAIRPPRQSGYQSSDYLNDSLRAFLAHRKPSDCVALRPSRIFSAQDDVTIVRMVKDGHGWSAIAAALNKPTSTVTLRFRLALDPRLRHGPFTPQEDNMIRAHVAQYGEGGWMLLSERMDYSRSNVSLRDRFDVLRCKGVWSDDERRRLLEGIVKHGRDWAAVAGHVDTGRTSKECRNTAVLAFKDSMPVKPTRRFTPEEDQRLRRAVEDCGRTDWEEVANFLPGRRITVLQRRYKMLLPKWLRVPYTRNARASLRALLRGDGDVENKLAAQFKDIDAAKGWVALELGMDDGSQVDWARVNGASGVERSAALDAVEKEIVPRVMIKEWKEGASAVWVPAWQWERPICTGRRAPIAAVMQHRRIRPFVAASLATAAKSAAVKARQKV